jgi:dihydrofolate reductase
MISDRKVILFIAMSVDGFIATLNDDLSFLSIVEQEGQDYGYSDFIKTVDTVIIGRKTYEKVITMGFDFPQVAIHFKIPKPQIHICGFGIKLFIVFIF